MKKIYLLLASFLLITVLPAKDVDKNYAMQVARNFYMQNVHSLQAQPQLSLVYECRTPAGVGRSSDNKPVYYAFDVNNGNGFVLVSGEDLVQPVLAYGTTGHYNPAAMAPATVKWVDNYKQQIVYVKENVTETTEEISKQWYNYYNNINAAALRSTQAVAPLCATTWNQSPYENGMTPYDNNYGERTVTGCVATAMAQVMKFWNYPEQGTGFHSYNDPNYGNQSANFGSTTYQWNQMPNHLNGSNTAVATLMYHCGVAVEMNYGVGATGGSSAYVVSSLAPGQACAEYAYKTYFGYDPSTVQGIVRQNYSDANWSSTLKTELDNGRPIQYAGIGNGGGHTWVCDGYDANSFFHMNWGWGGNSDGYFSLNNLDPTALGAGGGTGGFNSNQQAVIGIKPLNGGGGGGGGGGTVNQDNIGLYAQTTVSANPVQAGSSFTVNADIANYGTTSFTGDFAAALFNSEGVFVDYVQEFTNQTINAGYHATAAFTINSLDVVPGTYIVGIFYKNGANNYSLVDPGAYSNPVSITVTGVYSAIQMYSNDTITPGTPEVNSPFQVAVDIANAGGSTFTGWVSADLFKLDGTYVTNIQEVSNVSMQSNYYYNFHFSTAGLNVEAGTYYIAFFSSPDQQNWTLCYGPTYPNPVQVTLVEKALSPDVYENNNTSAGAYPFAVNFNGNDASISTPGSNMHVGNDYDYYKINLPSGTNYSISARVHDSYNSGNGQNYTNDAQFSYTINGGNWSDAYDDVMPSNIYVPGGGTVIFFVSPYFTGTTGTYLLDLQIARGQNVGIAEVNSQSLRLFPNPAKSQVFIDAAGLQGEYSLKIYNNVGALITESHGAAGNALVQTDVSQLAAGMYVVQLKSGNTVYTGKLIIE